MILKSQRGRWADAPRICRSLILLAALLPGCPAGDEQLAQSATGNPLDSAASRSGLGGDAGVPANPLEALASRARIVSLSPLSTRFLVELGVGARIVAVDPASTALPGFEGLPITSLAEASRFDPDYVIAPALPADAAALVARSGPDPGATRIVEFAPHDLEDVFALCRSLGGPLVGDEEALQLERRIARPLALVGGQSPPEGRPGVVAIVDSSPLVIAGGHSFETDLIEIAGGTSLTHGSDDVRRPIDREALARLDPDLILVMTTPEPEPARQERIALELGEHAPVVFFPFPTEGFWLDEPERIAARLHGLIAEFRPQPPAEADSTAHLER